MWIYYRYSLRCQERTPDFHDYFEKFYSEVFFPTLDEQGIDTVVHMGDVFDNRKNIDFWSLNWQNVYFDPLQERNIKTYLIVGNHDATIEY